MRREREAVESGVAPREGILFRFRSIILVVRWMSRLALYDEEPFLRHDPLGYR